MKKRILCILLTTVMLLTLIPITAFAADYTITNGTPESAKETNHGYITVGETAAKDDTVTITVNPDEGYQLKSLTATPVAPTISTIGDVLATVEGFPEDTSGGTSPVAPSSPWINEKGVVAFKYSIALILMKDGYTYGQLSTKVKKEENCYTATIYYGSLTFNMENGILTSFEFTADPSKPNAADYVGTYTPASTPSAHYQPITPAQQTDGTYQFTMPDYNVTVTAEFEEIGGTGKTLPYSFDFETDMKAEGWTNIDADGDGQDWITATNIYGAEGWGVEGSRCAISQSYDNNLGAFNADNWLFSPAITIPEGGATVSWYEQSQDPKWPDFYEVYVSETNTEIDLSKMTEIFSGFAANPWTQRSVELEAAEYAGKTVHIAFRHFCYDKYMLEIDDFAVEAVAPAHTHAFTYTVNNGKQLTATCEDGCDKGYDTNPLTLTLTAPASLVYDGDAKAFTFADGETDAWTGAGLELPTITYYQKYSGQGWYTQLNEVPVNAGGDYMAEIVVNNKAAQVKFTIDKEKIAQPVADSNKYTYNGSSQTYSPIGFDATKMVMSNGTQKDAGTYEVSVVPTDRYTWADGSTDAVKFVWKIDVAQATVKADDVTKKVGEADKLTATVTGLVGKDTANVIEYTLSRESGETEGKYVVTPSGSDIQGNYSVTFEKGTLTIAPAAVEYKVIEGANSVWVIAVGESPTFRSNADFSKFSHVLLDGKELAKKYYKAESGSTIITLTPEFTATLAVGKHTIEIVSTDGSASTVFYIEETIANTDGEGFALSTATMSSAFIGCNIVGLAAVFFELKKKKVK